MLTMTLLTLSAVAAEPQWAALHADQDWKELGSRRSAAGPVTVRSKTVDGVGCVEGRAVVDTPAAAMVALSRNMVSAVDWSSADLATSVEVARQGADSFVLYQYYDAPGWTLTADRFWVIRGEVQTGERGGSYRYERVQAADYPTVLGDVAGRSEAAIEPPTNFGEWQFTEGSEGTEVLYRSCADIGGRVPGALVQWINTSQMPSMIADFVLEAVRRGA